MGLVQWGTQFNPNQIGSVPMTMDPININAAVGGLGCIAVNPCHFCNDNANSSFCVFPTVARTCTSCGLFAAGQLFLDSYYTQRRGASKVIIVITDGNANVLNSSYGYDQSCCGEFDDFATGSLVPGSDVGCDLEKIKITILTVATTISTKSDNKFKV